MTRPRRELVSVQDTPYYHIVSRCVRRAFLCGVDQHTQTSYEHRRQWIVDRIRILSSVFAIDVCAYAVMSNHYHIVLKLDPSQVDTLSDREVIERWTTLFKGPLIIQQLKQTGSIPAAHRHTVDDIVTVWRKRLSDLGWFMKYLNEPIARRANKEDNCTGHFWEARYKSQALRTDEALLSCMAYVDLNPVRAGMVETPETSPYTSVNERMNPSFTLQTACKEQRQEGIIEHKNIRLKPLFAFFDRASKTSKHSLPIKQRDYLELLDWTGRIIRPDKRGAIHLTQPPILQRLNMPPDQWLTQATAFEARKRG